MRRLLIAAALLLVAVAGPAAPASAHSSLIVAHPGPSDKPAAGLTTITLTFGALSRTGPQQVKVLDPAKHDRVRQVRLVGNTELEVTVEPLAAGVHLLQYTITPADGHTSSGGYYLDVRGGASTASHVPPGLTGLIITLGVVVVLLGLLLWRAGRRRPATAREATVE
jgi:methionine-rich copper-binding protein CopC